MRIVTDTNDAFYREEYETSDGNISEELETQDRLIMDLNVGYTGLIAHIPAARTALVL